MDDDRVMDDAFREHSEWIRMNCVKEAVALRPRAAVEEIVSMAMQLEAYVVGPHCLGEETQH